MRLFVPVLLRGSFARIRFMLKWILCNSGLVGEDWMDSARGQSAKSNKSSKRQKVQGTRRKEKNGTIKGFGPKKGFGWTWAFGRKGPF